MSDAPDPTSPLGLIGGIGLTEVTVYAQRPAPDSQFSGCPHVHAVTDEGYYVLRGRGHVEFHDLERGMRVVALNTGDYLHFPPLVLHRLVSTEGLVILGIMGNVGLAERGEARVYFGREVDADAGRYAELMSLPRTRGLDGALDRRDASVRGYVKLVELWHADRPGYFAELRRFFEKHRATIAAKSAELSEQVQRGPVAWARDTQRRIDSLREPLASKPEVFANMAGSESALGMCGVLRPMLKLSRV
jgi:mannose-6-phosphate isomerase-like protein (cupin superfamily)